MGLGKTIQTLCILSASSSTLPSLVVCPPSVVTHWHKECQTMFPNMNSFIFITGSVAAEQFLNIHKNGLLITSYEYVRSNADWFSSTLFDYVILDEGHLIRNPTSRLTQSVKGIQGNHRLILTGTPIQNNVIELWSLFDFLMPGYFGSKSKFNKSFTRPIMALKDGKDNEKAALALFALHRQLLPFILRRKKEDVLKDLPPKIITDIYCQLTAVQKEFSLDQKELRILTYPYFHDVIDDASVYHHSAKLIALVDLLTQCGLNLINEDTLEPSIDHKILIFAQHKKSLDFIEKLVFPLFCRLEFLRVDGDIPVTHRQSVVDEFSFSPNISILLLTTSIGSLGLNLQAADTVVMFEHSYNPQEDLQAMDRAHRLGQKRTVNVYRLITLDSIEERLMSLQQFKLHVSSTIVNEENVSMKSMDTSVALETMASSSVSSKKEEEDEIEEVFRS
ncbi:hypothetical protein GEMRC1_002308 [Eukaryota sp. GEM-RC1]